MNPTTLETSTPSPALDTDRPAWPRLLPGEVHVWQALLDDNDYQRDYALLSADEKERASHYRFERDRVHFVAGRARLRMILGRYLDRDPGEIVLAEGPHGKPRVVQGAGEEPLHFNVSHSDGVALYAVAHEGSVGVDIERMREIADWPDIAATVFTPQEQARIRGLPAQWRMRGFMEAWTRQEAFLKATGEGLGAEEPGQRDAQECGYTLQPLTPMLGYLATLASAFEPSRVVFTNWSDAPATIPFSTIETDL